MKVFTLTLVTILLIGASGAAKVRRSEKQTSVAEETKPLEEDIKTPIKVEDSKTDISEPDVDNKDKEVHKRGILHYGHGFAGHGGNVWPKAYASHYGYNLQLPGAHVHGPTALRYNSGFHYKTFAPASVYSGVSALSGALPTYASAGPAVAYGHQGVTSAAVATAQPFIIRPGGAVVQSYSVNYPQNKPAFKPVHSFASVAPVQQHLHPVQPVQSFASVAPVQHLHPVQSVQSVQHVHSFASEAPVQHLHPVHSVQAVQSVQPVQPIHTFQTVQHVQPVQPAQPVQHVHSFQSVQPVHHIHPVQPVQPVVQTNFVQHPAQNPQEPAVTFTPGQPAFPDIPQFPNPPQFPAIPSVPTVPAIPAIPTAPAFPASAAFPSFPSIPSVLNFPQPQAPTNGFFPVSVQPPLPQQPPPFVSFNPAAQFPGFGPVAGTPNNNNPEVGSAEASPQIPVRPISNPEPELPAPQPQPTQQPWKPVYYQPPTAESPLDRPSHTLLPPYGNSPAEGYLPPAPSSNGQKAQQEYTIDSQLFDNLSDADIQNIFAQANLAAENDHHHHTVHNYHSSHY